MKSSGSAQKKHGNFTTQNRSLIAQARMEDSPEVIVEAASNPLRGLERFVGFFHFVELVVAVDAGNKDAAVIANEQ